MVSTFRREACYPKLKAADSSAAMATICHTAHRHGSEDLDTAMRTADLTWFGTYCADIGRPVLSLDLVLMQKDKGCRHARTQAC
jgi:Leu/Phe-tRNA-protein transferase